MGFACILILLVGAFLRVQLTHVDIIGFLRLLLLVAFLFLDQFRPIERHFVSIVLLLLVRSVVLILLDRVSRFLAFLTILVILIGFLLLVVVAGRHLVVVDLVAVVELALAEVHFALFVLVVILVVLVLLLLHVFHVLVPEVVIEHVIDLIHRVVRFLFFVVALVLVALWLFVLHVAVEVFLHLEVVVVFLVLSIFFLRLLLLVLVVVLRVVVLEAFELLFVLDVLADVLVRISFGVIHAAVLTIEELLLLLLLLVLIFLAAEALIDQVDEDALREIAELAQGHEVCANLLDDGGDIRLDMLGNPQAHLELLQLPSSERPSDLELLLHLT